MGLDGGRVRRFARSHLGGGAMRRQFMRRFQARSDFRVRPRGKDAAQFRRRPLCVSARHYRGSPRECVGDGRAGQGRQRPAGLQAFTRGESSDDSRESRRGRQYDDTFNSRRPWRSLPMATFLSGTGMAGRQHPRGEVFEGWKIHRGVGHEGNRTGRVRLSSCPVFDSKGRLFVGDRNNRRIQIFDQNGKFLTSGRSSAGRAASSLTSTT